MPITTISHLLASELIELCIPTPPAAPTPTPTTQTTTSTAGGVVSVVDDSGGDVVDDSGSDGGFEEELAALCTPIPTLPTPTTPTILELGSPKDEDNDDSDGCFEEVFEEMQILTPTSFCLHCRVGEGQGDSTPADLLMTTAAAMLPSALFHCTDTGKPAILPTHHQPPQNHNISKRSVCSQCFPS
jgi:hypothetical protein